MQSLQSSNSVFPALASLETKLSSFIPRQQEYQEPQELQCLQLLEKIIQEIYSNNISSQNQLNQVLSVLPRTPHPPFGQIYSLIRSILSQTCRNHRSLIDQSYKYLLQSSSQLTKITQQYPESCFKVNQDLSFFYQAIVEIIYLYFLGVLEANVLVCRVWAVFMGESQHNNNKSIFITNTNNPNHIHIHISSGYADKTDRNGRRDIRIPELHVDILNYLALKQLLYSPDSTKSIHTISADFHKALQFMQGVDVANQSHVKELLEVFRRADGYKYKNGGRGEQVESPGELETKSSDKFRLGFFDVQIMRGTGKEEREEDDDEEDDEEDQDEGRDNLDFLRKQLQNNPLGKILTQGLGTKFFKSQEAIHLASNSTEKIVKKIARQNIGIDFDSLGSELNLGGDLPSIRVIQTSELLKAYENRKKVYSDEEDQKPQTQQKKKKKKKKQKPKNKNKSKPLLTPAQLSVDPSVDASVDPFVDPSTSTSLSPSPPSLSPSPSSIQLKNLLSQVQVDSRYKEYGPTIRMLRDLKIDDSGRMGCWIQADRLRDWGERLRVGG